jgi:hypothetical protein
MILEAPEIRTKRAIILKMRLQFRGRSFSILLCAILLNCSILAAAIDDEPSSAAGSEGVGSSFAGPDFSVRGLNARLEQGASGIIEAEIANNAPPDPSESILGLNGTDALGVNASIVSNDRRITVLSGAIPAGTIPAGGKKLVNFSLASDPTSEQGAHPLEVVLNYVVVDDIIESGEEGAAQISILYANQSRRLPLEVVVEAAPKLIVEAEGPVILGDGSVLRLRITNDGGTQVQNLSVSMLPSALISWDGVSSKVGTIRPGESAKAALAVTASNADRSGEAAVSFALRYNAGSRVRHMETSALVQLQLRSGFPDLLTLFIAFLLVLMVAAGFFYVKNNRRRTATFRGRHASSVWQRLQRLVKRGRW